MQTKLSPKDFAVICQQAAMYHEYSWTLEGYTKDWDECAQMACSNLGYNPQWAKIIAILLYSDVWDWYKEVTK